MIYLSILTVCLTAITSQLLYYAEKRKHLEIKNTAVLSAQLEKELKDIHAFKEAVKTLTLKAGLKF